MELRASKICFAAGREKDKWCEAAQKERARIEGI